MHSGKLDSTSLPVMEYFQTIQGEGFHQGKNAYFIRLGGCDVGCPWCDVKESWDASDHPNVQISTLVEAVKKSGVRHVVITGGEPLMYDLTELTKAIKSTGAKIHVETSGAYPLTGTWDWITLSPKKFKQALPEYYPQANELKIIVFNEHDLEWAETHAARVEEDCQLYLQPEWSKAKKMLAKIIEYKKSAPKWHTSLQLHKYIGMP